MTKKLYFLGIFVMICFVFSCKKQEDTYSYLKINTQINNNNYKSFSLNDIYYDLLYDIIFTENIKNASKKINYFEQTAHKKSDSLAIYRSNNLQILLNPEVFIDQKRYKTLFNAVTFFENKNSFYDASLTNYLIAEHYFLLQYLQLAENYAYKSIENLGSNNKEYAFEKANILLLINNIHKQQKKYKEALNDLKNYNEVANNFDKNLVDPLKIKLLEIRYTNDLLAIQNKISTKDANKNIKKLAFTYDLSTQFKTEKSKIIQLNTLHNLINFKINAHNTDSLDYYVITLKNEKKFIFNIPVLQLNYLIIGDYLIKIKKDTAAAKIFYKNILRENNSIYKNNYLEKDILEQFIQQCDSSSALLNKHYINVVKKTQIENDKKLQNNQKIIYENHFLVTKNAQLKREIYVVVLIIVLVAVLIILFIFNIVQKINLKQIQLKNNYLEQDTRALEVTLNYKNTIENRLNLTKKQIFMELHDNIVNKFFSTRFLLHKDYVKQNSLEIAKKTITEVKDTLVGICDNYSEMNHLFEKDSFHKMLIELIENQPNNKIIFDYDFDQSIEWFKTSPKIKFHLYRVLQELLQNIHKHSSATYAKVQIFKHDNTLKLIVLDNGKGFSKNEKKGIGMENISIRLAEINAHFKIENNNGTQFIITIKL